MIKKVLTKNKTRLFKKFPEYDSTKMYVLGDICVRFIKRHSDGILEVSKLDSPKREDYFNLSYNNLEELIAQNPKTPIYALNTLSDLTNYIEGSREFPRVKLLEIKLSLPLANDEVLMPTYFDKRKIFGLKAGKNSVYTLCMIDSKYSFLSLETPWITFNGSFNTIEELIKTVNEFNDGICSELFNQVYQFDTYKEFLEWSLEQIISE